MPGVVRPTTIVDVLGTLNQQNAEQTGDLINGFGDFAETDEQSTITDSATVTHSAPPGWDLATWGSCVWQ